MAEYISRDAARAIIEEQQKALCPVGRWGRRYVDGTDRDKYDELQAALDTIDGLPAADVAEVRHGRWITTDTLLGRCCVCSVCGSCPTMEYRYCPYCGAKMDGGADNGERNL